MSDDRQRQTGAEIEVTPEMIEAGVSASFGWVLDEDRREEWVSDVIRSALEAGRKLR